MKIVLIAYILNVIISPTSAQWNVVFDSGDNLHPLSDIEFVSIDTGYAIGPNNIYQSIDSGDTWTNIFEYEGVELSSISFYKNIGYVLGSMPSNSLVSFDNGNTWSFIEFGSNASITDSWCINADTCFASRSSGYIIKTEDGWETYDNQLYSFCDIFSTLYFVNSDTGYAGGYNCSSFCNIYKTTDAGSSWSCIAYFEYDVFDVNKLFFPNINKGYAIVSDDKIATSFDAGNSWNTLEVPLTYKTLHAISFLNDTVGYIAGDLGGGDEFFEYFPFIAKTSDGGATWAEEFITDSVADIVTIYCLPNGNCFAGTSDGKIISNKVIDTLGTSLPSTGLNKFEIFPNPAKNDLHISSNYENEIQQITLMNFIGENMYVHFDNSLSADISQLSTGIYFIEVITSYGKQIQKWIKL